eukprot:Nk52_evm10s246 gene=Nk52_evmTU10s246
MMRTGTGQLAILVVLVVVVMVVECDEEMRNVERTHCESFTRQGTDPGHGVVWQYDLGSGGNVVEGKVEEIDCSSVSSRRTGGQSDTKEGLLEGRVCEMCNKRGQWQGESRCRVRKCSFEEGAEDEGGYPLGGQDWPITIMGEEAKLACPLENGAMGVVRRKCIEEGGKRGGRLVGKVEGRCTFPRCWAQNEAGVWAGWIVAGRQRVSLECCGDYYAEGTMTRYCSWEQKWRVVENQCLALSCPAQEAGVHDKEGEQVYYSTKEGGGGGQEKVILQKTIPPTKVGTMLGLVCADNPDRVAVSLLCGRGGRWIPTNSHSRCAATSTCPQVTERFSLKEYKDMELEISWPVQEEGYTAVLECPRGFTGTAYRECGRGAKPKSHVEGCQPRVCAGEEKTLYVYNHERHLYLEWPRGLPGTITTIDKIPGYAVHVPFSRMCTECGKWMNVVPGVVHPILCPLESDAKDENGVLLDLSWPETFANQKAELSCDPTKYKGTVTRQCRPDGEWESEVDGECELIPGACKEPLKLHGGKCTCPPDKPIKMDPPHHCVKDCPHFYEQEELKCSPCALRKMFYFDTTTSKCVSKCPPPLAQTGDKLCVRCQPGSVYYKGECHKECPFMTTLLKGSEDMCRRCYPNEVYHPEGKKCLSECPEPFIATGLQYRVCEYCPTPSLYHRSIFINENKPQCIHECPAPYVPKGHACVLCSAFKDLRKHYNEGHCVKECPLGTVSDSKNICYKCQVMHGISKRFYHNGTCVRECPSKMRVGIDSICIPCEDGLQYYVNTDSNIGECVEMCPFPYTAQEGVCRLCPKHLVYNEEECVPNCPLLKYKSDDGICLLCPQPSSFHSGACVTECPSPLMLLRFSENEYRMKNMHLDFSALDDVEYIRKITTLHSVNDTRNVCLPCPQGTLWNEGLCVVKCPFPKYAHGGICRVCHAIFDEGKCSLSCPCPKFEAVVYFGGNLITVCKKCKYDEFYFQGKCAKIPFIPLHPPQQNCPLVRNAYGECVYNYNQVTTQQCCRISNHLVARGGDKDYCIRTNECSAPNMERLPTGKCVKKCMLNGVPAKRTFHGCCMPECKHGMFQTHTCTCVPVCPSGFYPYKGVCRLFCPPNHFEHGPMCVRECPRGYSYFFYPRPVCIKDCKSKRHCLEEYNPVYPWPKDKKYCPPPQEKVHFKVPLLGGYILSYCKGPCPYEWIKGFDETCLPPCGYHRDSKSNSLKVINRNYFGGCNRCRPNFILHKDGKCRPECSLAGWQTITVQNYKVCAPRCKPGYFLFGILCVARCPHAHLDGVCFSRCPDDYFYHNGRCMKSCPMGTHALKRMCVAKTCENCQYVHKKKCLSQCPTGMFIFNKQCLRQCPPGTFLVPNTHICKKVCKGYVYNGHCHAQCPPGTVAVNENCVKNDTEDKSICPSNTFLVNGLCEPLCPPGYFQSLEDRVCRPVCPEGYFLDKKYRCLAPCPQVKGYWRTPEGDCLPPCPAGFLRHHTSYDCVPMCPDGMFRNIDNICVQQCPSGGRVNPDGSCSKLCKQGHKFLINRQSLNEECVAQCPPGSYDSGSACTWCSSLCSKEGCFGPGDKQCFRCAGHLFRHGDRCVPACPTGTFVSSAGVCEPWQCMEIWQAYAGKSSLSVISNLYKNSISNDGYSGSKASTAMSEDEDEQVGRSTKDETLADGTNVRIVETNGPPWWLFILLIVIFVIIILLLLWCIYSVWTTIKRERYELRYSTFYHPTVWSLNDENRESASSNTKVTAPINAFSSFVHTHTQISSETKLDRDVVKTVAVRQHSAPYDNYVTEEEGEDGEEECEYKDRKNARNQIIVDSRNGRTEGQEDLKEEEKAESHAGSEMQVEKEKEYKSADIINTEEDSPTEKDAPSENESHSETEDEKKEEEEEKEKEKEEGKTAGLEKTRNKAKSFELDPSKRGPFSSRRVAERSPSRSPKPLERQKSIFGTKSQKKTNKPKEEETTTAVVDILNLESLKKKKPSLGKQKSVIGSRQPPLDLNRPKDRLNPLKEGDTVSGVAIKRPDGKIKKRPEKGSEDREEPNLTFLNLESRK